MPVFQPSTGVPGVGAEKLAAHRTVGADGYLEMLPGGVLLDGARTRDPGNDDPTRLRAGLLIGRAGGKCANSVIGLTQGAIVSTATSVTLTPAAAAELVRRVGPTGTLRFVGPPTAAGTVATFTETYSAVNTSNGVVTISAADAALVTGSLVCADDGSHAPVSFLPDGWELVLPGDGTDLPLNHLPVAGLVDGAKLLPWPADASLRQWVRDQLNASGKFVFAEKFA